MKQSTFKGFHRGNVNVKHLNETPQYSEVRNIRVTLLTTFISRVYININHCMTEKNYTTSNGTGRGGRRARHKRPWPIAFWRRMFALKSHSLKTVVSTPLSLSLQSLVLLAGLSFYHYNLEIFREVCIITSFGNTYVLHIDSVHGILNNITHI